METTNQMDEQRQRRSVPAPAGVLFLNGLFFGAGFLLIGQWKKCVVALAIALLLVPLTFGYGLPLWSLLTAIDGWLQARVLWRGGEIGTWTIGSRGRRVAA